MEGAPGLFGGGGVSVQIPRNYETYCKKSKIPAAIETPGWIYFKPANL